MLRLIRSAAVNGLPGAAIRGLPLTVRINLGAELPLLGPLLLEEVHVVETLELAGVGLEGVLQAEQRVRSLPRLLGTLRAVLSQHGEPSVDDGNRDGIDKIAFGFELCGRVEPVGRSRMTRNEHELAVSRSLRRPFQKVATRYRRIVLVDAEQGDVEVVRGEREVVRIPPKKAACCSGANTSRTSVYFL